MMKGGLWVLSLCLLASASTARLSDHIVSADRNFFDADQYRTLAKLVSREISTANAREELGEDGLDLGESNEASDESTPMVVCQKSNKWHYGGEIKSASNKCITGDEASGKVSSTTACDGLKDWVYNAGTGAMQYGSKCLAHKGDGIGMEACDTAKESQQFVYTASSAPILGAPSMTSKAQDALRGEFKSKTSNTCISTAVDGDGIGLSECSMKSKHQQFWLKASSSSAAMTPLSKPSSELGESQFSPSTMVICMRSAKWNYAGSIMLQGGKCLDTGNGITVRACAKAGPAAQSFKFSVSKGLLSSAGDMCVEAHSATDVQMAPCDSKMVRHLPIV